MSVTLKALQQIERERDLHEEGQRQKSPPMVRTAHPSLSAGSTVGGRMPKRRIWLAMAALTVAAAGLIIGDRWVYRWRAAGPEVRGRTNTQASTTPVQVAQPLEKPPASSSLPRIDTTDFAALRPVVTSPTGIDRSAADPADPPPGSPPTAAPGSPPLAAPELDRLQDIKTYAGDSLKMQAIVWGPEERQRMAVINDQVVHTGDRFGQWVLTRIEEDAVIVQEEHAYWRVFLGR